MIIKNATIKEVKLGFEDHGILTSYVILDYGGSGQGLGGFCLGGEYTDYWVRGILESLELKDWNDLVGTNVRVKLTTDDMLAEIIEIGHIIKDLWFNPRRKKE